MRELFVDSCIISDGTGSPLTCDYFILVDEMRIPGGLLCESYGVKLKLRESGELSVASHLTISVARIDALLDQLIRNTVTPCALEDVLADWL